VSDGASGLGGNEGAIISWKDSRSDLGDIYAQHVAASGALQWPGDGVAVCRAAGEQREPAITTDDAEGAIIGWRDLRSAGPGYGVYTQHVTHLGQVDWTEDGVALCTGTGDLGFVGVVPDNSQGAVIRWGDVVGGGDVYAIRIGAGGRVITSTEHTDLPAPGFLALYPNPSRGPVRVSFVAPRTTSVSLEVFDVSGRRVYAAPVVTVAAGKQLLTWDGRTRRGSNAPAGVYFVRVRWPGFEASRRVIRIH